MKDEGGRMMDEKEENKYSYFILHPSSFLCASVFIYLTVPF